MKPNRREVMLGSLAGGLAPAAAQTRGEKPNIVIVMADQHRVGLTRREGCALDTMPSLDRLAGRGVAFDRAYTTAPLCVPARVSLLTGRWPQAHRVRQNSAGKYAYFEKDFFDITRGLGYATGLTGKNHNHLTEAKLDFWREYSHANGWMAPNAPVEFKGFEAWMQHLNHGVSQEPTPFPAEAQFPHRIASDAIEFVRSAGNRPFALWVSFPEPHNPYQVPRPYFDMFPPQSVPARTVGPEALKSKGFKWEWLGRLEEQTYPGYDKYWRRTRSNYLGMLRLIDDQVNRLVEYLDSSRVMENTIFVYLADHGDYFCDYGLMRKGVELPEALTRIPMTWAGWGVRPQQGHPAMVSLADVMPTLCEAIGAPIPRGAQGRSLWPLLQGREYPREEFESIYAEVGFGGLNYTAKDEIDPKFGRIPGVPGAIPSFDELNPVTQSGNLKMVRAGDWKLTFDMMGTGRLYNLADDPYELKNRYGLPQVASTQTQLLAELLRWTIRTQDDLPQAQYAAKWAARNWYAPHTR
jgi:arylsulfatase A-like enzyme